MGSEAGWPLLIGEDPFEQTGPLKQSGFHAGPLVGRNRYRNHVQCPGCSPPAGVVEARRTHQRVADGLVDGRGDLAAFSAGQQQGLAANEGQIGSAGAADAVDGLGPLPVAVGECVADDCAPGGPEFADTGQHGHHLRGVRREAVAGEYRPAHALWKIRRKSYRYSGSSRVPYNYGALDFQGVENL